MKTVAELKAKVESDAKDPIERTMIALCSNFHPLMIFVPDFYKEEYKKDVVELTQKNIIIEMERYIDFAFEKTKNERGISANRSIWKYKQWLWALEDTEITDFDFEDYGTSLLTRIANKYNLKGAAEP